MAVGMSVSTSGPVTTGAGVVTLVVGVVVLALAVRKFRKKVE